jgi:protein archease
VRRREGKRYSSAALAIIRRVRGSAEGEPWRAGLERGVEVKGATLTGLEVKQRDGIWEARCVVDV